MNMCIQLYDNPHLSICMDELEGGRGEDFMRPMYQGIRACYLSHELS